jgi:MSHA biogenesis protein MshQ
MNTLFSLVRRWACSVLAVGLTLLSAPACADTPISLFKSFAGNVNFTGTEATIRSSGTNYCSVYANTTQVSKTLSTVPTGATVVAAYLYWAGSGATVDPNVIMDGKALTAQRTYTGSFLNGTLNYYFSGVVDVTAEVKAKSANGNGTYKFSGLTVDTSANYCNVQGVLGGFALMVVYSLPSETFRVLNIYEGFESVRNSTKTLSLSNFKIPNPIGTATGRVGHITWEGDQNLNLQGEDLTFNGVEQFDANNPVGNQFNSSSNIDGDTNSYGIDFDTYTVGDPVIKANDTTATTVYSSGQDLVWLNVEIIAVPNTPVADLGMTMVRTGNPVPGGSVSYALTVTNNGPNNEAGPVSVTDTLPPGMTFSSISGTGWSCTISGQSATCTSTGVTVGQSLPAITVKALVSLSGDNGSFTNTATVLGAAFDNTGTNDTAVDTSYDTTTFADGFIFTVGQCTVGVPFGTAGQCSRYSGPFKAADSVGQGLYISAISSGVPVQYQKNATTINLQFSLTCVSPSATAGVAATFAGKSLTCYSAVVPPVGNAAWSTNASITFAKGASSNNTALTFKYADVGMIQLNMKDSLNVVSSTRFVSAPSAVAFVTSSIKNSNNGVNAGTSAFAKAGETFTASVKATMADGNVAPNFGNEVAPYGPVSVTVGAPAAQSSFVTAAVGTPVSKVYPLSISYSELGAVDLTPLLQPANGTGYAANSYFDVPVTSAATKVGYFYPAYFETTTQATMTCATNMACPTGTLAAGESVVVSGSVYSFQPFSVAVRALNAAGKDLTSQLGGMTGTPLDIALTPYDKPGPTGATLATLGSGTYKSNATPPALTLKLPIMYDASVVRTSGWTAPASAYVRATMPVARVTSAGTTTDVVSSSRTGGLSKEGGVRVVNGRMLVANALGSELLKLPLNLFSQYWTGSQWENLLLDSSTVVPNTATFTNCQKLLVCSGLAMQALPASATSITLSGGKGGLTVAAPGANKTGSAQLQISGTQPWLPSTKALIAFGIYKSRIIFIREVY